MPLTNQSCGISKKNIKRNKKRRDVDECSKSNSLRIPIFNYIISQKKKNATKNLKIIKREEKKMKKQVKNTKRTTKPVKKATNCKTRAKTAPKSPVKPKTTNKSTTAKKVAKKPTTRGRISSTSNLKVQRVQENKNGITIYFK